MKNIRNHRLLSLCVSLGVMLSLSCSSGGDSPVEPVDTTPQPGHVYTWAGNGQAGYGTMGKKPTETRLYWPQDVTVGPDGTPYVIDWNNHRVFAVQGGLCRLIVGVSAGDFGDPCVNGPGACQDIVATESKLNHPTSVAVDPITGDLILSAWHNSEIFRIDMTTGLMDLISGTGARCYNGDEQPAASAWLDLPAGVVFDAAGRLYFADQANMVVRVIDELGVIHCFAGTAPIAGACPPTRFPGFDGDGGPATSARLRFEAGQAADPSGKICFDADGNLYIADSQNHVIRIVDTNGIINTVAGVPTVSDYSGDNGPATSAKLSEPRDVAVDADGNLYIADTGNHVIRMVDTNGIITTVVGKYHGSGPTIAPITSEKFRNENGALAANVTLTAPYGIEIDQQGRLLIADTRNHAIRIYYPE